MVKGQSSVDWIIGMAVFLSVLAVSFVYVRGFYMSTSGLGESELLAYSGFDKIMENISHDFYSIPVMTSGLDLYPYEVYYPFPSGTDNGSITLSFPTGFNSSKVMWVGNESWFEIYFSKRTDLHTSWETDLRRSGMDFYNSRLSVNVSGNGDITHLETSYLSHGRMNVSESSCYSYLNYSGDVVCSDLVWRFYPNTTLFRFYGSSLETNASRSQWRSNITNGSINYTDSSLLYDNYTDILILYDSGEGLAFIGDIHGEVYNNGTTYITPSGPVLVYPYKGPYTVAESYKDPGIRVGAPAPERMVLKDKLLRMNQSPYGDWKEYFGFDFRLEVDYGDESFTFGAEPRGRNIGATRRHVTVYSDGRILDGEVRLLVW
ncbi:MAG: hypothetical protein DRP11_03700 [Candidatus Aenigmatarchaeota archaeon]|nr:MAG: hypothetical protein DRP11_03700 [Candidatus Aenigmarchaeota archaeon]